TRCLSDWSSDVCSSDLSYAIAVDPTNPSVVYDANSQGVSKSTDGGSNWTPTAYYNIFSVFSIALDPNNPSVIYGGIPNGVIKSRSEERRVGKECRGRWS